MSTLINFLGLINLGGLLGSLIVLVVVLFTERGGPWGKDQTDAVLGPVACSLVCSVSLATFGLPLIPVLGYLIYEKLKHPESTIW